MSDVANASSGNSLFTSLEHEIDRPILKVNYKQYHPQTSSNFNTPDSYIKIEIPREDTHISLYESYLQIEVDVLKNDNSRFVDDNRISLINMGVLALFSEARLSTSSDKTLENINHLHPTCLMYKLLTSPKDYSDPLSGFEKDVTKRRQQLTNDNPGTSKGKLHFGIPLSDIFGYAEHQRKSTYGMGYRLELKGNTNLNNNALIRENLGGGAVANDAKIEIKNVVWNVPHYIPSLENQKIVA